LSTQNRLFFETPSFKTSLTPTNDFFEDKHKAEVEPFLPTLIIKTSIKDYNLWGYHLFFEFLHTQQNC
jgi:hypothetical protein